VKDCGVLNTLLTGKGHVYYGLFAIFILAVLAYVVHRKWAIHLSEIADMVLVTGIVVDLWSHCYRH